MQHPLGPLAAPQTCAEHLPCSLTACPLILKVINYVLVPSTLPVERL